MPTVCINLHQVNCSLEAFIFLTGSREGFERQVTLQRQWETLSVHLLAALACLCFVALESYISLTHV